MSFLIRRIINLSTVGCFAVTTNIVASQLLLLLLFLQPAKADDGRLLLDSLDNFSAFCETETFNATCDPDHVVLITHARYGRMRISRCVRLDYGHIGCSADVTPAADARCSGRRKCEIRVPDAEFAKNKPCPDDLKPYLEVGFKCVKVQTPTSACPPTLSKEVPIQTPSGSGVLASLVTDITGCGRAKTPWIILFHPGQIIHVSVYDFGIHARRKAAGGAASGGTAAGALQQHPTTGNSSPSCLVYAVIWEPMLPESNNITVCGGIQRHSSVYVTATYKLGVALVHQELGHHPPHFLIEYQAVGCPDLPFVVNSWSVRSGDLATVRCNSTRDVSHMKCVGNKWVGDLVNCTPADLGMTVEKIATVAIPIPYGISVAIVLVIAFTIGIFVLCAGLVFLKRQRSVALRRRHDCSSSQGLPPTDGGCSCKHYVTKTFLRNQDDSDLLRIPPHDQKNLTNADPYAASGSIPDPVNESPVRTIGPRPSPLNVPPPVGGRDAAASREIKTQLLCGCQAYLEPVDVATYRSGCCSVRKTGSSPKLDRSWRPSNDQVQYFVVDNRKRPLVPLQRQNSIPPLSCSKRWQRQHQMILGQEQLQQQLLLQEQDRPCHRRGYRRPSAASNLSSFTLQPRASRWTNHQTDDIKLEKFKVPITSCNDVPSGTHGRSLYVASCDIPQLVAECKPLISPENKILVNDSFVGTTASLDFPDDGNTQPLIRDAIFGGGQDMAITERS